MKPRAIVSGEKGCTSFYVSLSVYLLLSLSVGVFGSHLSLNFMVYPFLKERLLSFAYKFPSKLPV